VTAALTGASSTLDLRVITPFEYEYEYEYRFAEYEKFASRTIS
jgi:hypothetical protein